MITRTVRLESVTEQEYLDNRSKYSGKGIIVISDKKILIVNDKPILIEEE